MSKWPRTTKSDGISWRPRAGSQPPLDEEPEPVSQARPSFPDLEIELPPKKRKHEIVVTVADADSHQGERRRSRRTYSPGKLIERSGRKRRPS